jgi:hypothetical protein
VKKELGRCPDLQCVRPSGEEQAEVRMITPREKAGLRVIMQILRDWG